MDRHRSGRGMKGGGWREGDGGRGMEGGGEVLFKGNGNVATIRIYHWNYSFYIGGY